MRLYVNSTKCSGCRACLVACSLNLFHENNPKKAALQVIPHFPTPGIYEVLVCTQCGKCAAACPTGAIKQNSKGAYYIDFSDCTLCGSCEAECAEAVMFVRPQLSETAWKCDLCSDCVSVCGTDALWISN